MANKMYSPKKGSNGEWFMDWSEPTNKITSYEDIPRVEPYTLQSFSVDVLDSLGQSIFFEFVNCNVGIRVRTNKKSFSNLDADEIKMFVCDIRFPDTHLSDVLRFEFFGETIHFGKENLNEFKSGIVERLEHWRDD